MATDWSKISVSDLLNPTNIKNFLAGTTNKVKQSLDTLEDHIAAQAVLRSYACGECAKTGTMKCCGCDFTGGALAPKKECKENKFGEMMSKEEFSAFVTEMESARAKVKEQRSNISDEDMNKLMKDLSGQLYSAHYRTQRILDQAQPPQSANNSQAELAAKPGKAIQPDSSKVPDKERKFPHIKLSVPMQEHEFGDREQHSEVNHTFSLYNSTDRPLYIGKISSSCGCTVPTISRPLMEPGKVIEVNLKYDSSRIGPFNKTVTIGWKDAEVSPVTLRIKGVIKRVRAASKAKVDNTK